MTELNLKSIEDKKLANENGKSGLLVNLVFVFLGIVGILGTTLFVISSRDRYEAEAAAYQQEKALLVSSKITGFMASASQVAETLKVFAEDYEGQDPKVLETYLMTILLSANKDLVYGTGFWYEPEAFQANKVYFGPYVHRDATKGRVLTYEWNTPEYNYHSQAYYTLAKASLGKPIFTEPYIDGGITYMTVGLPFYYKNSDRVRGTISVDMILPQLQELIDRTNKNSEDTIFISSAAGAILAHPRNQKIVKSAVESGAYKDAKSVLDIKSDFALKEFKDTIAYSMTVPDNQWRIHVISQSAIIMSKYHELKWIAVGACGIFITFLIFSAFGLRWFNARIANLRAKSLAAILTEKKNAQDILDNVTQGIMVVGPDLRMNEQTSRHISRILDKAVKDIIGSEIETTLLERAKLSASDRDTIKAALRSVIGEDSLNWDANESHLPRRLILPKAGEECTLELDWIPMINSRDEVEKVMLVIRDITESLKLEKAVGEANERSKFLAETVSALSSKSREQIFAFFKETITRFELLQHKLNQNILDELYADLHTIKGGARTMKLKELQSLVHDAETSLSELKQGKAEQRTILETQVAQAKQLFNRHLDIVETTLNIPMSDKASSEGSLLSVAQHSLLEARNHIRSRDLSLASFRCIDHVLDWKPEFLAKLNQILVHAFANAIDHGYALPIKAGALARKVDFELEAHEKEFTVEIILRDFGYGFDEHKIQTIANARGIKLNLKQTYSDLLFETGFSTADTVSDTSGRGVGLSAIHSFVLHHKGSCKIRNHARGGCELVIELSKDFVMAEDHSELGEVALPLAG